MALLLSLHCPEGWAAIEDVVSAAAVEAIADDVVVVFAAAIEAAIVVVTVAVADIDGCC